MKGLIKVEQGGFTPTEQRLLDALADGKPHSIEELATIGKCEASSVRMHMSNLRTKIRARDDGVVVFEDGAYRKANYIKP